MGSPIFKQLALFIILALALQGSSVAFTDQPMISTDRSSYNPWENVHISINDSSNVTAHIIDPWNSLTELILTPSEGGYSTEYSPQQGVVLGTYTILVSGEQVYETSEFDIRTLSINPCLEQYYTIGDIPISGNVVDTTTDAPVNASVNITIDGQTINTYATEGDFSATYMADSIGQKTVSFSAIDEEAIIGSASAGFEVYSSYTDNLAISTSNETYEAGQNIEVDVTSELGEPVMWITNPLGEDTYLTVHEKQGDYWGKLQLDNGVIIGEYWAHAQVQDGDSTEEVKIPFNLIAPSQAPESLPKSTPDGPEMSFSRLLSGHKVGQHKVPPIVNIDIEITAEVTSTVSNAILIDHYPEGWIIQDGNGGEVDTQNHTIMWDVGDVGSSVSRSYTIFSPQRTLPTTDYDFATEMVYEGGSDISDSWTVKVADPTETSNLYIPTSSTTGGWTYPEYAYLDGGDVAYTEEEAISNHFYGYDFSIPEDAVIDSVRVRADAFAAAPKKQFDLIRITALYGHVVGEGVAVHESISPVSETYQLTNNETTYWIDITNMTSWTPELLNGDEFWSVIIGATALSTDAGGDGVDGVSLDWIPVEVNYTLNEKVKWGSDALDLGEGEKGQSTPTAITNLTSVLDNQNVTVEFASGAAGKFSHNWTSCDMVYGETKAIQFTCDNSENGDFYALFNVTSDNSTIINQINVSATVFSYATLDVTLDQPIDGLVVNPGGTFTVNATVTCVGEPGARAGDIYALARYGNLTADTNISTTYDASPFFIAGADGEANFSTGEQVISSSATGAYSVYAIDVDSDGDIDVLSASVTDDTITWYENDGSESFAEHVLPYTADGAESVYAIDLDDDGDTDILSASFAGDKIAWYENDGAESFAEHVLPYTANGANCVYATDIDGDGDIDILGSVYFSNAIVWYENDGAESFTEHVLPYTVGGSKSVYAIDVDSDGDVDFMNAALMDGIAWYENDGTESFTEHSLLGGSGTSVYAIDMDGDNDIDILSTQESNPNVVWQENIGSGTFTSHVISNSTSEPQSVYAIDVDSDGDIDVLSAGLDDKIVLYENDGSEYFTETIISSTASDARSVYATDVDGDGYVDVLSASQLDNKIAWYENTQTAVPSSNPKTCLTTMNPGDTWNVSWIVNVTGGANPQYEVDVLFYSSYGNSNVPDNNTTDSTVIIVDSIDPVINSISDTPNDVDIGENVTINASVSDNGYVSNVWVQIDGINTSLSPTGSPDEWSVSYDTSSISSGIHDYTVYANDSSGNSATPVTGQFTVWGYATLNVEMDLPVDNHTVNPGETFTINATVTVSGSQWDRVGNVSALARYGSTTADTAIIKTDWASPFFILDESMSGEASFAEPVNISTTVGEINSVYATDIDGDNDIDVLTASLDDNKLIWYENSGGQIFTPHSLPSTDNSSTSVHAVDLDSDGDMDVLGASRDDDRISWYRNDGNASFTELTISTNSDGPRSLDSIDMDGDGDIDVLSSSQNDAKVAWYENDGNESFTEHVISTSCIQGAVVTATDLDGDGDVDVLATAHTPAPPQKINWYENDGNESFTEHTLAGVFSKSLFTTDVDGDGDIDVLGTDWKKFQWHENDGNQTFTTHDLPKDLAISDDVKAADFDNDGDVDLLVSATFATTYPHTEDYPASLTWYENDGSESFTAHSIPTYSTMNNTRYPLSIADVDGDGDMDIVAGVEWDEKVVWYGNTLLETNAITSPVTLSPGDTWNVSWTVNVTGENGTQYEVDTLFYSTYGVINNDTADSTIIIGDLANGAPVLSEIGPQSVNESELLTVILSATDPNDDPITYGTNATFGNLSDNVFTWTPSCTQSGTYVVNFTASDGELSDFEVVTITVNETYIDVTIFKSIEEGAAADSYDVTLNLTNNAAYNITGMRIYDVIPTNFTLSDPVPVHKGSESDIYYWNVDLVAGESKTITYNLTGSGEYSMIDAFKVGVGSI
ncbi:FG-GAP-like repeat-containing protein [Methanococcoides methylutens]|uniref:FG-GAP-like repeat-containing protein n=1 Tax=Methanococcoides methylutens TaxID=2226 RepID=UPI0040445970